jgi:uncharacterized protein (TIGR02246 family)
MMSSRPLLVGAVVLLLAGCQAKPAAFNPEDPAELAAIDSVVSAAVAGAEAVDADRVLAIAEGPAQFTFVTGDVLLDDLASIKRDFRATYRGLQRQHHQILERRVRLVAPGVALFTTVGEGTYTDQAGWTSDPVGLGMTMVLVKHDGKWQAVHAHQSVAF